MKTLKKLKNRLENENGLDCLLADLANVEDYYTEEYNEAAKGGFDFDLMYDVDEDKFCKCNEGEGKIYQQFYNMLTIGSVEAHSVEDLIIVIEYYIEQKSIENEY
jgi:hypothetical protein